MIAPDRQRLLKQAETWDKIAEAYTRRGQLADAVFALDKADAVRRQLQEAA